jgi:hypothetical protein
MVKLLENNMPELDSKVVQAHAFNLFNIFTIIEQAAAGAAQALQPTIPGIAVDINLGVLLLTIIQQLLPHAKVSVTSLMPDPVVTS